MVVLIAALSSVAPMGIDTYLPSMPEISKYFNVNIHKIEMSLTIFLVGFCIGQIFGGPISDIYGRRIGSISGLLGYALFSFLIIYSSNVYELLIYRFLEAFFGGITAVNAVAAVRDRFEGKEAAKVFSNIGMIRSITPLIAPIIGSSIIHFFPWEGIFVFLTIFALVVAFFIYKDLPESFTYIKQPIFKSYLMVLTHKTAMKAMIVLSLSFAGFFIIISKASYIYIEHFKISTDHFPIYFGVNFIFLILMIKININLLKKYSPLKIMKFALIIQAIAGFILALLNTSASLLIVVLLITSYMCMLAFIFGNCMSLAIQHFNKNAGIASSVIGILQFGLGGFVSTLVLNFNYEPFLVVSISITLIAILSYFIISSYQKN